MDDIVEMGYQKKQSVNTEAKFENKTLWSYADAYKTDHRNQEEPGAASTVLSLDERIQVKLAEYDIDAEGQLGVSNQNPEEEKAQREKEKAQLQQTPKVNAKHHYDKEDLISFHQIFISKPLVKAC